MTIRLLLAGTMATALAAGTAAAQAATAPAVPPTPATPPSAHPLPTLPEKIAPPAGTRDQAQPGQNTNNQNTDNQSTDNQSTGSTPPNGVARGVVHPPAHVDPGSTIKPPAPQHFTMPVIPPPGTPGNAPQVQPK